MIGVRKTSVITVFCMLLAYFKSIYLVILVFSPLIIFENRRGTIWPENSENPAEIELPIFQLEIRSMFLYCFVRVFTYIDTGRIVVWSPLKKIFSWKIWNFRGGTVLDFFANFFHNVEIGWKSTDFLYRRTFFSGGVDPARMEDCEPIEIAVDLKF